MATKYDRDIEARQERAKRQQNIDYLRSILQRDEDILQVMPVNQSDMNSIRERQVMHENVLNLRAMLNDEIAAYNKTYEAKDEDLTKLL